MKFVKRSLVKCVCICSLTFLAACSSQLTLPEAGQKVALKASSQFVPIQSYDEKGNKLVYVGHENPYLSLSGRIDKGSVLLFIEAKRAKRNNDLKKASQKLKVITKNDTSLSGPWVMLGDIALENKNLKEAAKDYKKAILINPKNINAYVALAKAQRLMGEYHVAQNTLVLALELWQDFPEAHLNLAILYDLYLNKANQAQQHFEAYLFLTQYKNQDALAWYHEVQDRTGIQSSFIDSNALQNDNAGQGIIATALPLTDGD